MLLSCIIGDQTEISNDWSLQKDNYGNTFISNEDIRQRIRIGKNVGDNLEKAFEKEYSSAFTAGYNISEGTFISNSNKNMNLSLMKFWSDDQKKRERHVDDTIVYITMMNKNYKLIDYDSHGHDIVQTYRMKDNYQGCAVLINDSDLSDDGATSIFIFGALELKSNRFVAIRVSVDKNKRLYVEKKSIEELEPAVNSMQSKLKKLGKRAMHFKLWSESKLFTNTYLVSSDCKELANDLVKSIPNAHVLVVTENEMNNLDSDTVDAMFTEFLVNERIRAITTIGLRIPLEFCKKYSILYLFKYDTDNHELVCLRSN